MNEAAGESPAGRTARPVGSFEVTAREGRARTGTLRLAHGIVETPAFVPVGTQASVKGISPEELAEMGAPMILANAYHLYLRPGHELIRDLGGLHRFMGWGGPILTDSGGYQVFSLAAINDVSDEGVRFQSHIDGSKHFITPELVMEIEVALGADVIMALDECPPGRTDRATLEAAVERTQRWLERCVRRFDELGERTGPDSGREQVLLPVIQGGSELDLRKRSLEAARKVRDWPGFGIGGLSVGEPKRAMVEILTELEAEMSPAPFRYLMGVGYPGDLLKAIELGYDLFDCVAPTRNGRNGTAFTSDGTVNVKLAAWRDDERPMEPGCGCYACRRFSRAYVRHLFVANELLGLRLVSLHNLHFILDLMGRARTAVREGLYREWASEWLDRYNAV